MLSGVRCREHARLFSSSSTNPLLLCLALLYTCAPRTHTTRSPSPRRPDWTRDAHSAQHAMGPHGMRARCAPIVAELGEASRRENAAWDSNRRYAGDQGRRQCARCSKVAHAHWFVEALVASDAACALCFAWRQRSRGGGHELCACGGDVAPARSSCVLTPSDGPHVAATAGQVSDLACR